MPLTSVVYLLFLTAVAVLYYAINHRWRIYLLLAASAGFYCLNQGAYLLVLLLSIVVNYLLCRLWLRQRTAVPVYTAVLFNIALLGFFKYLPAILGIQHGSSLLGRLAIPIGLSFFSFQAMGYMLDLRWSNGKSVVRADEYALYMSFFPQLLSGPIARSKSFLPQISTIKAFNYDDVVMGMRRILWGIFKKVVIASNLSPYTDAIFGNTNMHQGVTILIAAIAFTIQIYMDFSGYTDIAIGSARILGYNLLENFRTPLFARSVTDFWRRWHITLSSWVRDYVFVPLQFKLRSWGMKGTILATLLTFLIIGIWHAGSWNLVIFGLLQGLAISWEILSANLRQRFWAVLPAWLGNVLANGIVFLFIVFSAVFLRAASLRDVANLFSRFSLDSSGIFWGSRQLLVYALFGIVLVAGVDIQKGDLHFAQYLAARSAVIRWTVYILCTVSIILIGSLSSENFIYFQY